MSQQLRFSVMAVEEIDRPRPHYRVEVRGALTAPTGLQDPTLGLLPEDIVMTVRLPIETGSDLTVIRKAACARALTLLETLVAGGLGSFDRHAQATPPSQTADA